MNAHVRRHRWWWILPAVVFVVAVFLTMIQLPARVAFTIARGELEQQAQQVLATPVAVATQPVDVSAHFSTDLIKAFQVEVCDGGVFFATGGTFFDIEGICYLPPAHVPATAAKYDLYHDYEIGEHLGGHWYRYYAF